MGFLAGVLDMFRLSLGRPARHRCPIALAVCGLAAIIVAPSAVATPPECQTRWLDGVPTSDIYYSGSYLGGVRALTMWDPDGDGPEPERLVAGGTFDTIGGIGSPQVAAWVPGDRNFTALGNGFTGFNQFGPLVSAVGSIPNSDGGNDLYVAGNIASYGGVPVNGIARWDGTSWVPLGEGLSSFYGTGSNPVSSIIACADGKLVVVGSFLRAGGLPAPGLAVWDGSAWSVPVTFASGNVNAVACLPDNSLIIGGSFTSVNGEPIVRAARILDGVASSMGGEQIGNVSSLAVTPNGTVYATSDAPTMRIWRWDDGTWTQIGIATTTQYTWDLGAAKIIALADDSVALSGYFTSLNGEAITNLARFDGGSWEEVGSPQSSYAASQLPDGRIVTARTEIEASSMDMTAPLMGEVPQLTNGGAYAVEYFEGDLVIAGNFTAIQGVPVTNVARRTANGWQQMGSLQGVTDLFNRNGTLYAAGWFEGHVARWTGEQWAIDMPAPAASTLPAGNADYHITEHDGQLLLSYFDGLSRFLLQRETVWEVLPGFASTRIGVQVASAEGRLYSGGSFNSLFREFDGTQWVDLYDSANRRIQATSVGEHQGHLYVCYPTLGQQYGSRSAFTIAFRAGGSFVPVGYVSYPIRHFHSTASGDLYAFSESQVIYRVRDGVVTPVVNGVGTTQWYGSHTCDMASDEDGRVTSLRHYFPSGNDFAEFLDPRPVALRDVPTEVLVCQDGRADVAIQVLGTLDRTVHWEWDGAGEFALIADGIVDGLGVISGSTTDAITLESADVAALGTRLRLVASDACNLITSEPITLVSGTPDTYACARCAPCSSDYDQDGSTDGSDIGAFFADYEQGLPCADIDLDGAITGTDVGAFFVLFEGGGC